jgi:hypothetical protein
VSSLKIWSDGDVVQISCSDNNWKVSVEDALGHGHGVELSDFDYSKNGAICETLARTHRVDLVFIAVQHLVRFSAAPATMATHTGCR